MIFVCQINSNFLNLIIGAFGSLIASVIFLQYTKRREKDLVRKKYSEAVGNYIGYGPTSDGGSIINKDRPLSKVEIIYLKENLLQITVTEINDPHVWRGVISMESNHYGTLAWRYIMQQGKPVDKSEHIFGLKKFVYFPIDNKKVCYLMGDLKAGYFNEFLIEN